MQEATVRFYVKVADSNQEIQVLDRLDRNAERFAGLVKANAPQEIKDVASDGTNGQVDINHRYEGGQWRAYKTAYLVVANEEVLVPNPPRD
jgi:hypothetical protein